LEQALTEVTQRGLKRVAILFDVQALYLLPELHVIARKLGILLQPRMIQCLPVSHTDWAFQVIPALFAGSTREWPDSLIITDEVGIPAVQNALDELDIGNLFQIHLTNLPLPPLSTRPALRLGWDHHRYLQHAISMIQAWHDHGQPIGDAALPLEISVV
jgi:hypothetical protein